MLSLGARGLRQLPLALLTSPTTSQSSLGRRVDALRCLEALLTQPGAARSLVSHGDLLPHKPGWWEEVCDALRPPRPGDPRRETVEESGLRLRVCASVLSQCLEARASEAPPAHITPDEAREAPGRLHEADQCMNEPSINE